MDSLFLLSKDNDMSMWTYCEGEMNMHRRALCKPCCAKQMLLIYLIETLVVRVYY